MNEKVKTVATTAAATAIVAGGIAAGVVNTTNNNENVIDNPNISYEIVDSNKLKVIKKKFDNKTGQELQPIVEEYSLENMLLDRQGKEDYISLLEQKLSENKLILKDKVDEEGNIKVYNDVYDEETGKFLKSDFYLVKKEDIENEIIATEETIVAVEAQINELEELINKFQN